MVNPDNNSWWAVSQEQNLEVTGSTPQGLSSREAWIRLRTHGSQLRVRKKSYGPLLLFGNQLRSPIVILLISAALVSFSLGDQTNGLIILTIILISSLLGFWQEFRAGMETKKLQNMVEVLSLVLRDHVPTKIPLETVVPGDIILLSAGSSVPADCFLLECRDLFVDEALLTGETFPVEKNAGRVLTETVISKRTNCVFQGTHIVSGTGKALAIHTAEDTEWGAMAHRLGVRPDPTDFERGVRRFGTLILRITLILTLLVFGLNIFLSKPAMDSFLFALALAVGLTPELLPAIISVNLASGARRMAAKKVIVKRLVAIENFGSMDLLCSDKTGTLTEGNVRLSGSLDVEGHPSGSVLRLAAINGTLQTGFANPMDEAIMLASQHLTLNAVLLDEIPYDFSRKRLSVLAKIGDQPILIVKGALNQVLDACTTYETSAGETMPLHDYREAIQGRYGDFSMRGLRTLALATKVMDQKLKIDRSDEVGLTLRGFLLFADPPRLGIAATIKELKDLGVALKIITGDNRLVAAEISRQIGFHDPKILTGLELGQVSEDALPQLAHLTDIFAEVEPNQKERIIQSLRKAGHVVGYLGDGINDASALRAADVGLSVQGAVDIAKDAADIVLLDRDLEVLIAGIKEGRKTFANTMKYVFMATSANFGNMFSMAGASLFLPFLPLLPQQILLINLLTDLPEMAIATDLVSEEAILKPQRWDITYILKFMLRFGLLSSFFDFATFAILRYRLQASAELFRTGWFVESVVSASLIVLIIRTPGASWKNRPSWALLGLTVIVVILAISSPYCPLAGLFGLVPLPASSMAIMGAIVLMYACSAELWKRRFFKSVIVKKLPMG